MPRVSKQRTHSIPPYLDQTLPSESHPSSSITTFSQSRSPSLSPACLDQQNSSASSSFQNELYPYQKGKKVTAEQLAQLLDYFSQDDNPSKEHRVVLANRLQMSFKALSIWFQNERANVKKGRARILHPISQLNRSQLSESTPLQPDEPFVPNASTSLETPKPDDDFDQDYDEACSVHSQESEESLQISTPDRLFKHLPDIQISDCANDLDEEGVIVAQILVRMKNAVCA